MEHSKYDFDLDVVNTNSLSLIINRIKRGSVVLEFGPANGRMTKYLKEQLDCSVYLVEADGEAGREALLYGKDLVVDDIETYSWYERYENIRFDYITFADVLEHLREPEKVIMRAKQLLKQDGSIIVSVPNMAHNSVIISLLNNELEYTNVGLLDNSHIHFFTKNSLENMMLRTGLVVANRYATYAPTGTTEIPVHNDMVCGIDESFWKTRKYGEVYQFVYEAKKGPEFVDTMDTFLSDGVFHYFARLYFDRGGGYNDDDFISMVIRNTESDIVFEAAVPEDVKGVRLVPFDGECLVEPLSFTDLVEGDEKNLRIRLSSEDLKYDNKYMFTENPPYFDFGPVADYKFHYVRLIYRLITIDKTAIGKLNGVWGEAYRLKKKYEADIADFSKELNDTRAENTRLNAELTALSEHAAYLDNHIKEIYGTFTWKFAERLRRIRNKFVKG